LARELALLALQLHHADRLLNPAKRLGARDPAHPQAEADVPRDAHVREQRIVLEHHAEAALLGAQAVDAALVEPDAAAGRGEEACDEVERRRLSAARGPEQRDELALPDRQRDVLHGVHCSELPTETLEPELAKVGGMNGHSATPPEVLPCREDANVVPGAPKGREGDPRHAWVQAGSPSPPLRSGRG
jgi:hypothetical protein